MFVFKCPSVSAQLTLGGGGKKEPPSEKSSENSLEISEEISLDDDFEDTSATVSLEKVIKEDSGPKLGASQTTQCTAGIKIVGGSKNANKLYVSVVVPMEWPEQKVRIVKEVIPPAVNVSYRDVGVGTFKGGRIMEINIPKLPAGKAVEVLVTFEVIRQEQLAPTETAQYVIPKAVPKDVRVHLLPSPKIESNDRKFKQIFKETTEGIETDWKKVEAVYDYVREKVRYREELKRNPVKGALAALKDGDGDCEDMCALFVAICRAGDVPARTVFVKGHCYAEFYLEDETKKGYWFPCQVSGSYAFGNMPDKRYVVQKGDNFRIDKEQLRFIKSVFTGEIPSDSTQPKYEFVQIR